ncbi:Protein of unknown function [Bacillus cereus]|nr:Protein of unknown function [Bacillus cereus]
MECQKSMKKFWNESCVVELNYR